MSVAVAVGVTVGVSVGGTGVEVAVLVGGTGVDVADGAGDTSATMGKELASTTGVCQESGIAANPATPAAAASALIVSRRVTLFTDVSLPYFLQAFGPVSDRARSVRTIKVRQFHSKPAGRVPDDTSKIRCLHELQPGRKWMAGRL